MASVEKINEGLLKLARLIEPLKPLLKCHMVDFLTKNLWETLLPLRIRQDLLSLSKEKLYLIPSGELELENDEEIHKDEELCLSSSNLAGLLTFIRNHSLPSLGVTTPIHQVLDLHGPHKIPVLQLTGIMSDKKSHEVDVMSDVIARLVKGLDVNWILDLGSGKGYLSSSLVLQYGLNVLAMDSSPTNTSSALNRNSKLQKIVGKSKKSDDLKAEGKQKKVRRKKKSQNILSDNEDQSNHTGDINNITSGSYIGLTAFITEETDLLQILQETLASCRNDLCNDEQRDIYEKHLNEGDEKIQSDGSDACLGLVGLHTCGNLASSSIRLFASNSKVKFMCNVGCCYHLIEEEFCENPFHNKNLPTCPDEKSPSQRKETSNDTSLKSMNNFIANEGLSCQQKLAQESEKLDPLHPSTIPNLSIGFPMSSTLRERKFALERNTRMLSCQATSRLTGHSHDGLDSLYWRAVLQVILKDKLGDTFQSAYNVGRIAAKCKDFNEYIKRAIVKLKLDIEVTDEEISDYQKKYGRESKEKIECFFVLRSAVAPIIEGLILLDRVAFLKQQEDIESAYLVQLFDPVTSPRCHAVIGIRSK